RCIARPRPLDNSTRIARFINRQFVTGLLILRSPRLVDCLRPRRSSSTLNRQASGRSFERFDELTAVIYLAAIIPRWFSSRVRSRRGFFLLNQAPAAFLEAGCQ